MPGRCCDRCGAPHIKPATAVTLEHVSARGVECDRRTICLDCAADLTAFLAAGRQAVRGLVDAGGLCLDREPFHP